MVNVNHLLMDIRPKGQDECLASCKALNIWFGLY